MLHHFGWVNNDQCCFAALFAVVRQLFRFWFGRRIIHSTVANAVSKLLQLQQEWNHRSISPLFDSSSLPFECTTPFAYLITLLAEGASAHAALFCGAPILSFFFGSAWMIICSLDDISSDLDELNCNGIPNERNKEEIKKRFCHAIRFYSDANFSFFLNARFQFRWIHLDSLLSSTTSMSSTHSLYFYFRFYRWLLRFWHFCHNQLSIF